MSLFNVQTHSGIVSNNKPGKQRTLPACGRRSPVSGLPGAFFILLYAIALQAIADPGHNHGSVSENGRFTPNVEGAIFPPQPRNARNVITHVPLKENNESATIRGVSAFAIANAVIDPPTEAAEAAQNNAEVQVLLGDRYTLLQSARVRDKKRRNTNAFDVEFFSHSENKTVIARIVNGIVTDINSYAASDRQAPLIEEEKARAIDIARQYWVDQDDPRAAKLAGYAIQTFKPDGSPYESRVAYVSFHAQSPEPPELITWVDLSDEKVLRAEVVR